MYLLVAAEPFTSFFGRFMPVLFLARFASATLVCGTTTF
jgi:hypothetical protein